MMGVEDNHWYCCNCGDGPHNLQIHDFCSTCHHAQCPDCEGYDVRYRTGAGNTFQAGNSTAASAFSVPQPQTDHQPIISPAGQPSSSTPTRTAQTSNLSRLNAASERLAFSVGGMMNAPALLGISSELSAITNHRLEHLDEFKTTYRITLDDAIDKEFQDSFGPSPTAIEDYLRELTRPMGFTFAWEHCILPFLVKALPHWLDNEYAINVLCNSVDNSAWTICIMSRCKTSRIRRIMIARHILDVVPGRFHDTITFQFCRGIVEHLALPRRGKDKENWDEACRPQNPYFYLEPMMGDSIGLSSDKSAATLGPCVKISNRYYWLANLHVMINTWRKENWDLEKCCVRHPGCLDGTSCQHPPLEYSARYLKLGNLGPRSGDNLSTTRKSCHSYWKAVRLDPPEVVTDWVLIEDAGSIPNTLRVPKAVDDELQCPYVTDIGPVHPKANVASTGRTSGYQYSQICAIPAYVNPGRNPGALKATREWFIEQPKDSEMSEDGWLENGPGLPGDSGAPIVDANSNVLYGQLWGRNKYWGTGPRIGYFTAMQDIDLDIQEKMQGAGPLELPQRRAQDTRIVSRMACHFCQNSLRIASELELHDSDSDQSSEISLGDEAEYGYNLFVRSASPDPGDKDQNDWSNTDSDGIVILDSESPEALDSPFASHAAPADSPEIDCDNTDMGVDEAAIADMMWNSQYLDDATYHLTFDDEDLLNNKDMKKDDDTELPTRSFATEKIKLANKCSSRKSPMSSSWVMVQVKPKPADTESPKKSGGRNDEACTMADATMVLKGLSLTKDALTN